MKWTKRHLENARAARVRRRMMEPIVNEETNTSFLPPKSKPRFTVKILDHAMGDSLTLNLHPAPWPNRWLCAHGQFSSAKIGRAVALILGSASLLLMLLAGCAYDPISGPDRKHDVRPNPYGLTNPPAAAIDQFRAVPMARQLLPERMIQPAVVRSQARRVSTSGWEFMFLSTESVALLKQIPFVITNNTIRWTAPGHSRVIVSDNNTNWLEDSFTDAFRTNTASVPIPTNKYFRLVSP